MDSFFRCTCRFASALGFEANLTLCYGYFFGAARPLWNDSFPSVQYHEESLEEKEIKLFYPHTTYPRAKPEVSPGRNLSCTCSLGPIMQTLLSMGNFIRGKSNFFGFMCRWATFIGMHESRLQRHRCGLLHRNDAPPLFSSSSVEIEYFPFA